MVGQTLSEIRQLLAEAGLAPQHRFGQHFLIDLNLMRKLVQAAELSPADTVLEVGAGTGSLTEMLLERGVRLVAVEIDHGLQTVLRARLGAADRFTLVQGDALAGKHAVNPLLLSLLRDRPPRAGGGYKLVANLPYQIATPLLVDLLLQRDLTWERLTCTVQKEVGERLAAEAATEAYGPVSVLLQTLADVVPLAIIPPAAFWPRPQVESVMIAIRPRPSQETGVDDLAGFAAMVRRGFQERRKMLRRVFREWDELRAAAVFARAGVRAEARAEELSPPVWRALFHAARSDRP